MRHPNSSKSNNRIYYKCTQDANHIAMAKKGQVRCSILHYGREAQVKHEQGNARLVKAFHTLKQSTRNIYKCVEIWIDQIDIWIEVQRRERGKKMLLVLFVACCILIPKQQDKEPLTKIYGLKRGGHKKAEISCCKWLWCAKEEEKSWKCDHFDHFRWLAHRAHDWWQNFAVDQKYFRSLGQGVGVCLGLLLLYDRQKTLLRCSSVTL